MTLTMIRLITKVPIKSLDTKYSATLCTFSTQDVSGKCYLLRKMKMANQKFIDGSTTTAKKGGDGLGFNGHKHMKGEKVVALADRNCNVISPMTIALGNRHEGPLLVKAFN